MEEAIKNPFLFQFENCHISVDHKRLGYTKEGVCPHCGKIYVRDYILPFHCDDCNNDLTYWLEIC